jgi:hypothetical protein
MTMAGNEIVEAESYTGFLLSVPGPDGRERLVNVTEQEWRKHRHLGACTPRRAETRVISKWDIF